MGELLLPLHSHKLQSHHPHLQVRSRLQPMEASKLIELEKKLKREQGGVTRLRLEELLVEVIEPTKAAIVVDLIFYLILFC